MTMITHYLTKISARGELYWSITQDDTTTYSHAGQVYGARREFPPVQHHTKTDARNYVNRQMNQKRKQGYKKGRQASLQRTNKFDEDEQMTELFQNARHEHYQRENGMFVDLPGSSGVKRKHTGTSREWGPSNKRRTMQQEVALANERANYIRMGLEPPSDKDGDTDSVGTCSLTSYEGNAQRRFCGVSPLNKRRSMRLALKRTIPVDMTDTGGLLRQNTAEMTSPSTLVRMDTEKRWSSWRPKRQATSSMLKKGITVSNKMDTLAPEEEPKRPRLLKRLSTTTVIRQAFQYTKIEEGLVIPNVFETTPTPDPRGSSTPVPTSSNQRMSMHRLGGKKNTVAVMPSLDETDGAKSPPTEPQLPQSTAGATTDGSKMKLRRTATRPQMKRGNTVEATTAEKMFDGPSPKRMRQSAMGISRSQSIAASSRHITLPPRDTWPLKVGAQVVWRMPLTVPGLVGHGRAVCVTGDSCLVGDDTGKVVVVDDKVSVHRVLQLPKAVTQFRRDSQFIYGVCNNGQVYDITFSEPRLVFDTHREVKGDCLAVYDGELIVYEKSGHVIHYDHEQSVVWNTNIESGFALCVDETHVLCCTCVGVICLSLLSGAVLWDTPLQDIPTHAVKCGKSLYVTCGPNVLRLNTANGDVTRTYKAPKKAAKKGKSMAQALDCLAVGGGLVFACGQNIVCFEEESGEVVFSLTCPVTPCMDIQYFEGRVFCVGDGSMEVVNFSPDIIAKAQAGEDVVAVDVSPKLQSPVHTPLQRMPTVRLPLDEEAQPGVLVKCFWPQPRSTQIKVRAVSAGFSDDVDIQFPSLSSFTVGSQFVVGGLERSKSGGFYRVVGDIKAVVKS